MVLLIRRSYQTEDAVVRALLFVPYLAIVYTVASLSYRFYEAPFIRLKDVFFPAAGTKRKAVAAVVEFLRCG